MSDYMFIGRFMPPQIEEQIKLKMKNTMPEAANVLQWNIIDGVEANLNYGMDLLTLLPVGAYPRSYADAVIKSYKFSHVDGAEDLLVGHNNIYFVKRFLMIKCLNNSVKKWVKRNPEAKVIFLYSLNEIFIDAAILAKKMKPSIKVCCIVADLPEFANLSQNLNLIIKKCIQHNAKKIYEKIDVIDSFVLLAKPMADKMKIIKPYTVVEGIATDVFGAMKRTNNKKSDIEILYAGTLHKKFGVRNLVEAFKMIKDESFRLILCGVGDSEEWIKEQAKLDKRIIFKGRVERKEVLELMQNVTVIVNPRQNEGEFTKYSFPSKNLEALSSGTPFVAYKLDGIPDEYDEHIFYVENNTIEALADTLVRVCSMSENDRVAFGASAREFVLREKNKVKQAKKILELNNK